MNHNRTMKAVGRCFLEVASVSVLASNLWAAPMVYTGTVVTDVRVGTTLLHNATLKITFAGDSSNIQQVPLPSSECGGDGYFLYLKQGVARMQIQFQGHTRAARLQDGQIFVALDECNGGIGFGSLIGPNGLEPAYPLALTMGTAEYLAITDGSPLTDPSSTTGVAWSCIGYPPLPVGALPGTVDGYCTSPDAYPLKSDIGNIYVYQPYFEDRGEFSSNHSGSTNRGSFQVRPQVTTTVGSLSTPELDSRSTAVYTLQTVADGSIGGHVFYQALVTLRMYSNPNSVTTQPSPVDATKLLYENHGYATVSVDDAGLVINAAFAPGEVYVRYDTGAGVAGFGSQISPTYPVALNCANGAYPSDNTYTMDCLQGAAWDYLSINDSDQIFHGGTLAQLNSPVSSSAGVLALPQSLSQNTLLTGSTHACAGAYSIIGVGPFPYYFPGDLFVCGGPAPRGLHTNRGDLYLQDQTGGSLNLGTALIVGNESGSDPGWDLANMGFLHVEVYRTNN